MEDAQAWDTEQADGASAASTRSSSRRQNQILATQRPSLGSSVKVTSPSK